MDCLEPSLTIAKGRNLWLLARTDRDAPDPGFALQSAGAFLAKVLGPASPLGERSLFEVVQSPDATDQTAKFFIGAARPVTVTEGQHLAGAPIASWNDCDQAFAMRAQTPIVLTADFDWRAPNALVPWPRRTVNSFGVAVDEPSNLDWLLLQANDAGQSNRPDGSLGGDVAGAVKQAASSAVNSALTLAAIVAGGLVIAIASKGKR